ncbi:Uncharacterized protein M6B38_247975 [Iris pallida]|uniref:Knr4/Smi1-like domain-containing protein n=1 Tax=Iris pallida TaxID=29817 RepID=A0AAX6DGL4_IRIPA|nr:Uncharacterized protein M6B38_247975 [Iris pallida]
MPSATTSPEAPPPAAADPQPRRAVCFSFAAYAKAVISHLRLLGVPVTAGLSELEFTAIETSLGFSFPPDLRSVLREGLPIAPGFPNWRSSSPQQLRILLDLPTSSLLHEVSRGGFWCERAWGRRPGNGMEALSIAKSSMERAPVMVPIYRHLYVPFAKSNSNGNPIFYVRGGEVRCWGYDIADFFGRFDPIDEGEREKKESSLPVPAWAMKSARRVEVWSDLAGVEEDVSVSGTGEANTWREMGRRLREGGWREEEVWEMMGTDGGDTIRSVVDQTVLRDREGVMWHVRLLGLVLLRAGWSAEDVAYAMGEGGSGASDRSQQNRRMEDTWRAENEISIDL